MWSNVPLSLFVFQYELALDHNRLYKTEKSVPLASFWQIQWPFWPE